jgi:hypothetical protein
MSRDMQNRCAPKLETLPIFVARQRFGGATLKIAFFVRV